MATKRKSNPQEVVPADAKIARLMALAAMKDMEDNIEKALFLRSAGFVNIEIAAILNIHDGQVRTALMRGTKRKRRSSR